MRSNRPVIGSNYFPKKSYRNDGFNYSELNPSFDSDSARLQSALLQGGFFKRNEEVISAVVGTVLFFGFIAFIMYLPQVAAGVKSVIGG